MAAVGAQVVVTPTAGAIYTAIAEASYERASKADRHEWIYRLPRVGCAEAGGGRRAEGRRLGR